MIKHLARAAGGAAALAALAGALFLYTGHAVRGSNHQDSPTTVARVGASITDVFVYQAPDNPANVVLQMDAHPLIPTGMGPTTFFDPAVMYQFKIDNNGDGVEDLVIQLQAVGTGPGQTLNVYGPAAPAFVGTQSVLIAKTGTITFNTVGAAFSNGLRAWAGPAKDPFFFDLAQFFKIIPDRNFANQPNPPAPTATGFRGFTAAFNAAHGTSCDTSPAVDILSSNGFNILTIVVELPKASLGTGRIGVWATASTASGS